MKVMEEARQRIQNAYSPEHIRVLGRRLMDVFTEHLARVEAGGGHVLNWAEPRTNVNLARSFLADVAADDLLAAFEQRVATMLSHGNNLHDPRYIGHQVPAPIPVAALFDLVGSLTNQVMAIYEMGPWATAVERAVIEQLGNVIGWRDNTFAGLITHGGSLGNLTGLLTARNVTLGDCWEQGLRADRDPVIVVHGDAHYSVTRSAGLLGIGTSNVVRAELDERRRLDPQRLDELLTALRRQGHTAVAVSACACATPIGAFDPLADIVDVCQRHEVWLHVDAAHGGAVLFSERHKHLLAGIDQVDSLVWDAHKMMFMPALCAFVFYRRKEHQYEAFRQDAPYLFDPSAPGMAEFDSGLSTIECTKRAAAYGLWGIWSTFGSQIFADLVDSTFAVARRFHEMLTAADDFQTLHEPQGNIVAFRYVPAALREASPERLSEFQRRVRRKVIQSGEFYLVQTTLDGCAALRVTVMNPLTDETHLSGLMEAIRRHAQE